MSSNPTYQNPECLFGAALNMSLTDKYFEPNGSEPVSEAVEEGDTLTWRQCGRCSLRMMFRHDADEYLSIRVDEEAVVALRQCQAFDQPS